MIVYIMALGREIGILNKERNGKFMVAAHSAYNIRTLHRYAEHASRYRNAVVRDIVRQSRILCNSKIVREGDGKILNPDLW